MNEENEILDVVEYEGRTYNVKFEAGLIYFEDVEGE